MRRNGKREAKGCNKCLPDEVLEIKSAHLPAKAVHQAADKAIPEHLGALDDHQGFLIIPRLAHLRAKREDGDVAPVAEDDVGDPADDIREVRVGRERVPCDRDVLLDEDGGRLDAGGDGDEEGGGADAHEGDSGEEVEFPPFTVDGHLGGSDRRSVGCCAQARR